MDRANWPFSFIRAIADASIMLLIGLIFYLTGSDNGAIFSSLCALIPIIYAIAMYLTGNHKLYKGYK